MELMVHQLTDEEFPRQIVHKRRKPTNEKNHLDCKKQFPKPLVEYHC